MELLIRCSLNMLLSSSASHQVSNISSDWQYPWLTQFSFFTCACVWDSHTWCSTEYFIMLPNLLMRTSFSLHWLKANFSYFPLSSQLVMHSTRDPFVIPCPPVHTKRMFQSMSSRHSHALFHPFRTQALKFIKLHTNFQSHTHPSFSPLNFCDQHSIL